MEVEPFCEPASLCWCVRVYRRATPDSECDVGERESSCSNAPTQRVVQAAQETQAVHALPDDGPWTGIRLQLVHHATEALGDRVQAAPQRAPGQSLVSKPTDEAQEAQRES